MSGRVTAVITLVVHPAVIGNVLSQSGSYWVTSDWQSSTLPWPLDRDRGDLIGDYPRRPRLPIRFSMEVGRVESYPQVSNTVSSATSSG